MGLLLLQLYLEGLSLGVVGNIVNTYNGNTLNRLRAAFERGDLAAARLEQVTLTSAIILKNNLTEHWNYAVELG